MARNAEAHDLPVVEPVSADRLNGAWSTDPAAGARKPLAADGQPDHKSIASNTGHPGRVFNEVTGPAEGVSAVASDRAAHKPPGSTRPGNLFRRL